MDCIVLDDDDDVVMTEGTTAVNEEQMPKGFEKRLIRLVRKNRIIYDNKHKHFSNIEKKDIIWQEIAKKLKSDVDTCKSTWIELRYKYQCYVRRLRRHYINNTKRKREQLTKSNLESELIYLFRFIDNRKYCPIPYDIVEPEKEETQPPQPQPITVDDDLILIEQPVELIVIDDCDDGRNTEKVFKVSKEMKTLVEQVKKYPELYDCTQADFKDYTRKSYVWNTIAIQIGDKATKLMKCWILMITRYEWEISRNLQNTDVAKYQTELQKELEYFEPFVLSNPDTVYKHSYYLKQSWCEPIDYFKEIYNLIVRMKKIPDIVHVTDSLLTKAEKTKQFFNMWADVSKMKGNSEGECETTWLVMRLFYWELMNMRQHNYQLTDKWYFETIITELYELSRESRENQKQKENPITVTKRRFQYLNKVPLTTNVSKGTNGGSSAQQAVSTNLPIQQQQQQQQQQHSQQGPLPKITSAISLAPPSVHSSAAGNGALQIRPIGINPNIVVASVQKSAAANSLPPPTTATTKQLPHTLFEQTPAATVATTSIPVSNLKSILPAAVVNAKSGSNLHLMSKAANKPQVAIAPMVCINTPIKSSTVSSTTLGSSSQTPAPSAKPIASTVTVATGTPTAAQAPLPKISGAISLLNPNEILIELIASQSGNHLVVHGPPLSEKYQLSMSTVAGFIREVLAIPLLHNKRHNQPSLINCYWEHISNKFSLPPHICRACWNFLVENFNHFPQIAPLKELMKPFSTSLQVWTESFDLFKVFDQHAVANGWLGFMSRLPEVVECIGTYPVLYKDVAKNAKDDTSDMEALCVWRTISLRFPNISDISTIWTAFKNVFCQYMSDIEFGIDNKWHIHWWRVMARLSFLVDTRYTKNEPFYYIVSNKIVEEIERCAMIEMKNRYGKNEDAKGGEATSQKATSTAKSSPATLPIDSGPKQHVEMVTLLTAIEKYPIIYDKADCLQKYEAWKNVAKELQMDVTDCLLAFRRACQKYCAYKKQDTVSRCQLNQKYYKRFDTIFRSIKNSSRRKLNIRTPFELNQSIDDDKTSNPSTDFVYPERYISDISMSNCDSDLVVKNWIYAFGNLSPINVMNENTFSQLTNILRKYVPHSMPKK